MLQLTFFEKFKHLLLFLFFTIFFINLTIDDGINWSLNWILAVLFIASCLCYKKVYLPMMTTLTVIIPFISIYLVNLIFHLDQKSIDHDFNTVAGPEIIQNFLKIIPLILLPTLLFVLRKSKAVFLTSLNFSIIVSIIFNSYFNYIYNFDRGLLVTKFDAIILYDACLASISLVALVLNFKQKNNFSTLMILLALLNLFLIVGHGSRGTWLGIPIILILITFFFFKTQKRNVVITLLSSLILTFLILIIPNSPIHSRVEAFKQDTNLVQERNYHSSVGNRVFLWKYAIEQFQTSPLIGVGTKRFRDNICIQQEKGLIPACNPHAHNIFFQFIATHGLLGLFGILSAFLIPFVTYIKSYIISKKELNTVNEFSIAGICFTIFFGICGLTDFLFFTSFPTMFYFLVTISLMTFTSKRTAHLIQFS